ncbi:glutaredoxin family protein, partial [Oxalobacteraceae bacterium OM1]
MKKHTSCWTLLLLLCAAGAQAQLYKSVGPDGKVTYSDTPPAGNAKVEAKAISGGGSSVSELPYELQQAVQANPVVLYSSQNCLPCDEGRKLLTARGIPFTEKTVSTNEDATLFKTVAGGDMSLPLLLVGRQKERGFLASAWNG